MFKGQLNECELTRVVFADNVILPDKPLRCSVNGYGIFERETRVMSGDCVFSGSE
jgi:hypothetical protein